MANIIEREIAVREKLIADFDQKQKELIDLRTRVAQLENEMQNANVEQLESDIAELKTYLHPPSADELLEE